jgi:folate-dependent phosphoribosylglycinamide formyltransferase PurN
MIRNNECTVVYIAKALFKFGSLGLNIVKRYFDHIVVIPYDEYVQGEAGISKIKNKLSEMEYDYIISFWSELYLTEDILKRAKKGAINIHPAPPEHPGLGMFTFPRLFPHLRSHHGVTLHEMDNILDHGKIYQAIRFPIENKNDLELADYTGDLSLQLLDETCRLLADGLPTHHLQNADCINEKWHSSLYTTAMEKEWLNHLPYDHSTRRLNCYSRDSIFYVECGAPHDSMGESV